MPRRKKKQDDKAYDPFDPESVNPHRIQGRGLPGRQPIHHAIEQKQMEDVESGLVEGGAISAPSRHQVLRERRTNILGGPFTEGPLGDILRDIGDIAGIMGLDDPIDNIMSGVRNIKENINRFKDVGDKVVELGSGGNVDLPQVIDMFDVPNWASYIPDDPIGVYVNKILGNAGVDEDGDGDIDSVDVAISRSTDMNGIGNLKKIHPLLLKMRNDKNFHTRVIQQRSIITEKPKRISNQVSNVEQGYAAFDKELNRFNVRY